MTNSKNIKAFIVDSIKDLDKTDYVDICVLIKSNTTDSKMVSESARGTYIDLDYLDHDLLQQLDNMISTKLQRISER